LVLKVRDCVLEFARLLFVRVLQPLDFVRVIALQFINLGL
jgi:hypothetical protein